MSFLLWKYEQHTIEKNPDEAQRLVGLRYDQLQQLIQNATIAFLKSLLAQFKNSRLFICWDSASYHRSVAVRECLASLAAKLASRKMVDYLYSPCSQVLLNKIL
jgi:hypothetical protein